MKLKDSWSLEEKVWQTSQHIQKQRHHFTNKHPYSQSCGFSSNHAIVHGYESWTIKKAECLRTDAFKVWCCRRLLRLSWTARKSNQSILKEISPEYSLKGLMLKLELQYFGYLLQRANWLENPLMLGKIEGRSRSGWQRMRRLDGITNSMDMSLSHQWDNEGQGNLACCRPWSLKDSHMT